MTERIKNSFGRGIVGAVLACLMCVLMFSGCNNEAKQDYAAIGTRLDSLNSEITELADLADTYYEDGLLTDELFNNISDLKTDITELFGSYNETTVISKEKNTVFNDNIASIESKLSQYEDEFDKLLGDIDDVKSFAQELKTNAQSLESSITDSERSEYDELCSKLDSVISEGGEDVIAKAELLEIKQKLAVMASKVGADNATIDKLTQGVVLPTPSSEDNKEKSEQSDKQPVSNELQELIDSYTNLQNEASKSFDKGDISEEDYMSLLDLGIKVAEIKEKMEAEGESDTLNKQAEELKPELYAVADKMGSALKDKFK